MHIIKLWCNLADDINSDTRMILLNAVYFKGKWLHQFEKRGTHDRTFYVNEKTEKKVPTMYVKGDFIYGELPELKAKFIELPYEVINRCNLYIYNSDIKSYKLYMLKNI